MGIIEEPQYIILHDIYMYSNKDNYINEYAEELDIFENLNTLTINDANNTENTEDIPKYFINKKLWIKHTSLLCGCCGRSITNIPIPIIIKKIKTPVHITGLTITLVPNFPSNITIDSDRPINNESEIVYFVYGLFCNITCIGWYINKVVDNHIINKWETKELTLEVYKLITNNKLYDIPESINYIRLATRCGVSGLTDKDFDNLNERKIITYKVNE